MCYNDKQPSNHNSHKKVSTACYMFMMGQVEPLVHSILTAEVGSTKQQPSSTLSPLAMAVEIEYGKSYNVS